MAKPDRELEELDQRFAEVERTIQSACETMEKLKEASPKIEKIHRMSSEIHEIKDKALQEIQPVRDRLESLADRYDQAARMLESLKQELEESRDLTRKELGKCASLTRVRQLEERLEAISTDLGQKILEQNERCFNAVSRLSEILERHDNQIKNQAQEISKNAGNIKIALFLGAGALLLVAAFFFLVR